MKYTFKQFQADFPSDSACLEALMKVQFGGTKIACPGCGVAEAQFHQMTKRRAYACQECGHHIYPCAGTIFHKSRTKLTHWFFAMYLMTSTRHGVAAKELERQIGCTYKTAWRMAHELRKLMASSDFRGPLSGHVEVDEMFHGPNEGIPGKSKKAVVFGAVERGGRIRAGIVANSKMSTLKGAIRQNVEKGSQISSDDNRSYHGLSHMGYTHEAVNHSAFEWVRGDVHTNTIEGHWGLFRRSVKGTHVHVSKKHLWKYVSEFSYRRNMRYSHEAMFSRLVSSLSLPRLAET
ncbi:MAG TPA: IS1595 family transposase [Rhizomicrobium sp.]|nr:IS1595 family transposase [Rhizomicrobium sp.]